MSPTPTWWIYRGTGRPLHDVRLSDVLPPPPPWRTFTGEPVQPPPPDEPEESDRRLGRLAGGPSRHADPEEADAVNAAIYLRRPLLVTGRPGVGKSSLAYRISRELKLGRVLRWPISSRSTRRSGLYDYDAIGRAQDAAVNRHRGEDEPTIGEYIQLGPLGTALLPFELPRVLLIDELDKGDGDLPNDLLDVLEDGEYSIPELVRVRGRWPEVRVHTADGDATAEVERGLVRCRAFPVVIITSNGEREFPPAFLRRCIRFELRPPTEEQLVDMVTAHLAEAADAQTEELLGRFVALRRTRPEIAADQLLNAVFLATSGAYRAGDPGERLLDLLWKRLSQSAVPE
ncbi:MoxR family ATPase [Actinoallomurus spadix]|uniref:AAA family ATPase n=1 Tax=Actinoallomurus spadix TaxID=79912 RepID=UPI002092B5DF|nr:MoxR family ATPase [Actinoallomurus spadix]MCO5988910.1 MoxR family ATPase [Actinoallomurus spadix]